MGTWRAYCSCKSPLTHGGTAEHTWFMHMDVQTDRQKAHLLAATTLLTRLLQRHIFYHNTDLESRCQAKFTFHDPLSMQNGHRDTFVRSALHVRESTSCPPLPPALLPCHPHPPANLPGVIINAPAHVESAVPTSHMPDLLQKYTVKRYMRSRVRPVEVCKDHRK